MTLTGTDGNGDGTGTPNANGAGQHAGLDTCGKGEATDPVAQQAHESCCKSLVIPASVLPTGETAGSRLDKYEVTAGRMRQFIESMNKVTIAAGNDPYDLYDYMAAQFNSTTFAPKTAMATLFAAQFPSNAVAYSAVKMMPNAYFNGATAADGSPGDSIVAALGGTTLDPNFPSNLQGCYVADGAAGATTYWWPAMTLAGPPLVVGGDQVGDGPRPYTQDYYDIKSMNCGSYWIYAAFCAWDGGHVATLAEIDAVYGKEQYPWDTTGVNTFLPADYTYTTTGGHNYENFVPGTPHYAGGGLNAGKNAVDLTVNWNNNSFSSNDGFFYYYPNGGTGPTDQPASIGTGLDYSPFIAAPGRFYLDATAITAASGDSWQDLGANMLEITSTSEGGGDVFCDCSTGGQATKAASCPNACPGATTYGVPRNGGTAFPTVRWEGGSWEGHTSADPASTPYFAGNDTGYSFPLQTQYGKAGFRCARAPE